MVAFMHDRLGIAIPEGLLSWDTPELSNMADRKHESSHQGMRHG